MTQFLIQDKFQLLQQHMLEFLVSQTARRPELMDCIQSVTREIEKAALPNSLPQAQRLPGVRHLDAALTIAEDGPMATLARAFKAIEPALRWIRTEHYRDTLGDDYMDNYCYTNILGYDALIPHDRIIVAFLLIGPGRHYPRHHHEAEEIYFPFGGDTLWSQNDDLAGKRKAGEPIHNSPWLPHEMITQHTPLFTFCFWISPGKVRLAQLTD